MCKKLAKEGKIFYKIGNIGYTNTPSFSYNCIHAKTIESLFINYVDTFITSFFFDKEEHTIARVILTGLLLKTFKKPDAVIKHANESLNKYTKKELFSGLKSVFTIENDAPKKVSDRKDI